MSGSGPKKAFLLCAGKGTRFRPHTLKLPKSLIPCLNLPLIAYNLYLCKMLNVKEWSANIYMHPLLLTPALQKWGEKAGLSSPMLSFEEELLGSAGGLLKVKDFLEKEEHFIYLNGDSCILPPSKEILEDFYQAHIQSKALVTFLVTPTNKTTDVLWVGADDQVYFYPLQGTQSPPLQGTPSPPLQGTQSPPLQGTQSPPLQGTQSPPLQGTQSPPLQGTQSPPLQGTPSPPLQGTQSPYCFSGLAVFSSRIFREIKASKGHIFKDVLDKKSLRPYLQIYPVPNLTLLDMNQVDTYLKAVKTLLLILEKEKNGKAEFLKDVLDCFSPGWDRFTGERFFSAMPLPSDLKNKLKHNFLFCGPRGQGLEKLSVEDFAVLGEGTAITQNLKMTGAVAGPKVVLHSDLKNQLVI